MATITQEQALDLLREYVNTHKNRVEAARALDISPGFLTDVLNGNRKVSDKIAQRLGYRRVVQYVKVKE